MLSLEKASVEQNIETFAAFLGHLVIEGARGRAVTILPGAGHFDLIRSIKFCEGKFFLCKSSYPTPLF
jgi:hypothetical protein